MVIILAVVIILRLLFRRQLVIRGSPQASISILTQSYMVKAALSPPIKTDRMHKCQKAELK